PLVGAPSQSAKPVAQPPTRQVLETQALMLTLARAHTPVQLPQRIGSVAVFTHAPEQLTVPVPQVVVHVPEAHTWPAAHAPPQRPQLALSVVRFTSQPLAGFMSQSAKPVAQAPIAQVPDPQVAAALAKRHTTPQPPQLLTSLPRTAVSQPFVAAPS